ncbi:hypothetical protein Bbelb_196570 [Branchiostoma belcheri]|nr:hypothetical protein Bbelb_196570 [Branchiostoma belcheri]
MAARKCVLLFLTCLAACFGESWAQKTFVPLVINTWGFTNATEKAWTALRNGGSVLDAVEKGCTECEAEQCDFTVGYGGSPDEHGETTLDALIMDGTSLDVGAVADLRRVKNAISVARNVMEHTTHTMLVGEQATAFAIEMGFAESDLHTHRSIEQWIAWINKKCQPNYRKNVSPDPSKSCGPYKPLNTDKLKETPRYSPHSDEYDHDTIGMIVIGANGTAGGSSTNGALHKVPGRVGDAPIAGAGVYVDSEVGGAAGTGDGDITMRFLPSYQAVEYMRGGMAPAKACQLALSRIGKKYPNYHGALVCANIKGEYGAACHWPGLDKFPYSIRNPTVKSTTVELVDCQQ